MPYKRSFTNYSRIKREEVLLGFWPYFEFLNQRFTRIFIIAKIASNLVTALSEEVRLKDPAWFRAHSTSCTFSFLNISTSFQRHRHKYNLALISLHSFSS